MFHSKKGFHDLKKQSAKFLDPKKDSHSRLRALRVLIDQQPDREIKSLFRNHYTEIYYVFYEEFCNIEVALKSKGHKSQRDDLEGVLQILENLLLLIPEKINQKWQFNSIGIVLCKLLHHGNIIPIREIGIRLFMLWLQALQSNADEFCMLLYGSLVPGFPSPLPLIDDGGTSRPRRSLENVYSAVTGVNFSAASSQFLVPLDGETEWCCQERFTAFVPPPQGEKNPFPLELTKKFLDRVLDYMTRKMLDMQWPDKRMQESGFYYMFEHFKRFYLPHIFSYWSPTDRLYQENEDVLQVPLTQLITNKADNALMNSCRRAVLYWLIAFTVRLKLKNFQGSSASSTLRSDDGGLQQDGSTASLPSPGDGELSPVSKQYRLLCEAAEIVRGVLYATQSNVLCIHEILKQGFLMPVQFSDTITHVLSVYLEWLKPSGRALFMKEPVNEDDEKLTSVCSDDTESFTPTFRSPSYKQAVQNSNRPLFGGIPVENVRAGMQANLRVFITYGAQLFFVTVEDDQLSRQVEICRRVMKMYRGIILEMQLTSQTWRQMLAVLLRIAEHCLPLQPPVDRHQTLGGRMVTYMLETLFVSWIRASLQVYIQPSLWNELLRVVSSLTKWEEAVNQWANTVETLLRVMSRTLYGIDLHDPPLARLTEQKRKRLKGKTYQENRLSMASARSSFSRGWSRLGEARMVDTSSDQSPASVGDQTGQQENDGNNPEGIMRQSSESFALSGDNMYLKEAFLSGDKAKGLSERRPTLIKIAEGNQGGLIEEGILSPPTGSFDSTKDPFADFQSRFGNSAADAIAKRQESTSICSSTSEDSYSSHSHSHSFQQLKLPSSFKKLTSANSVPCGNAESPLFFDNETLVTDGSLLTPLRQPDVIPVQMPATDSLSDPDLISLEGQGMYQPRPITMDSQSLDSRMFTFFEGDSYPGGRLALPHGMIATGSVSEADNEDDDDVRGNHEDVPPHSPHVHFEETLVSSSSNRGLLIDYEGDGDPSGTVDGVDTSEASRSVILESGGREGWTAVSSVILWKRIIGVLGNVNQVSDPVIHSKVFEHLIQFWEMLYVVRCNLGISLDNKCTPPPPDMTPPLFLFLNWCFEAASMSFAVSHKVGRVLAYRLMCMTVLNRFDHPVTEQQLTHFYRLLHVGLTGTDQSVVNAIVAQCPLFLSSSLPGSYVLLLDFLSAANSVVSSQSLEYPRKEAVTLLGSFLPFACTNKDMAIYQPGSATNEERPSATGIDITDKAIASLLKAAKHDPTCHARCLALNSLSIFVTNCLTHGDKQPKILDSICIMLASLIFHHKSVSNVALGVVWSLHSYCQQLQEFDRGLPLRILEALCSTTGTILSEGKGSSSEPPLDTSTEFVARLLLCILDWALALPAESLFTKRREGDESSTFLSLIFKTFKRAADEAVVGRNIERKRSLNISNIVLGDTDNRPVRLARVEDDLVVGDREQDYEDEIERNDFMRATIETKRGRLLKLTSAYAITELLHQVGHFPLNTGAVRLDSLVLETDEGGGGGNANDNDEITPSLFTQSNVQFLMLNSTRLLSVVEIPLERLATSNNELCCCRTQCRFILRDLCGKYCWDTTALYRSNDTCNHRTTHSLPSRRHATSSPLSPRRRRSQVFRASLGRSAEIGIGDVLSWEQLSASRTAGSDKVELMLRYIGSTSPECLIIPDQPLNIPSPVPQNMTGEAQSSVVTAVLKQHNEEENYVHELSYESRIKAPRVVPPTVYQPTSPFHNCRSLLHQLGYLSWEKRRDVDLLSNSDKLLREIKNLDNRPARETHKFAVFYIASGQEDKVSILSNVRGSRPFEEFVSGLGWEVDLVTHTGFMGGLEKNLTTGCTAPYFATPTLQVIFHVSTRMPVTDDPESLNKKLRHLGNDEVHIVWSEHARDFRRGIVNTEFGDVLIVIYPLGNDLFRIQIDRKPEVPLFGPLFDGAVVDRKCLSKLVRNTAVNAGRTKRHLLPLFERHYEDRARCLREIAETQKQSTTFEDFAGRIFNPSLQPEDTSTADELAYLSRTFSLPARPSTSSDPSSMLGVLDTPDATSFRIRSSSAAVAPMSSGSGSSPTSSRKKGGAESPPVDERQLGKDKRRVHSVRAKSTSQRPHLGPQSMSMDV